MRTVISRAMTKCENGVQRSIMLADVKTSFLCGDARRSLYVELPSEEPLSASRRYVGKLERALYGTRDAPMIWQDHLRETLLDMKFKESVSNSSSSSSSDSSDSSSSSSSSSRGDVALRQEWFWQVRCSFWPTLFQWQAEQSLVVAELGCRRHTSVYGGFLKYFIFFAELHVALFALGNMVHYFLLVFVSGRHFLCLGVACGVHGIGFVGRLLLRRLLEEFHPSRGVST